MIDFRANDWLRASKGQAWERFCVLASLMILQSASSYILQRYSAVLQNNFEVTLFITMVLLQKSKSPSFERCCGNASVENTILLGSWTTLGSEGIDSIAFDTGCWCGRKRIQSSSRRRHSWVRRRPLPCCWLFHLPLDVSCCWLFLVLLDVSSWCPLVRCRDSEILCVARAQVCDG